MCEKCYEAYQEIKRLEARVNLLHEAVAEILYESRQKSEKELDSASSAE